MEFHTFEHSHHLYCQPVHEAAHSFLSGPGINTTTDGIFGGGMAQGMDLSLLGFNQSMHHHTLGQSGSPVGMGIRDKASAFIPYCGVPYVS
jgi:hypothetical protein